MAKARDQREVARESFAARAGDSHDGCLGRSGRSWPGREFDETLRISSLLGGIRHSPSFRRRIARAPAWKGFVLITLLLWRRNIFILFTPFFSGTN